MEGVSQGGAQGFNVLLSRLPSPSLRSEEGFGTATSTPCGCEGRFYGSYTYSVVLEKAIPYTDGTSYGVFGGGGGGGDKCQWFGGKGCIQGRRRKSTMPGVGARIMYSSCMI